MPDDQYLKLREIKKCRTKNYLEAFKKPLGLPYHFQKANR